jgi:hypothetical protein
MNAQERQAAIGRARSVAIARINGFLRRATDAERYDGIRWYPTAHAIAEGFSHEAFAGPHAVRQVAGVIAAISPGLKWERNLICARALILWHRDGRPKAQEPVVETYAYANVRKALAILDGEAPEQVLTGPKVRAFFHAILGENRGAVLDGHIANALRGEELALRETKSLTLLERTAWRQALQSVACATGLDVHAVQAIVWLCHKREKDNRIPF